MDYYSRKFDFNLQRFADTVTVTYDLAGIASKLSGTTPQYLVSDQWTETKPADAANLTAMLDGSGKLTVKAADTNIVFLTNATAEQMKGVKIAFCTGFTISGETISPTEAGEEAKVQVKFGHETLSYLAFSDVAMKDSQIAFDATAACKVTVPTGATLTVPDPQLETGNATLSPTTGTVTVEYTGKGNAFVVTGFDDKDVVGINAAGEADTLTVRQGDDSNHLDFAVTGGVVGHFVDVPKASATFTIPATGDRGLSYTDAGTEKTVTATAVPMELTLSTEKGSSEATKTQYFKVVWDGTNEKYTITGPADAHTEEAVGYFALRVDDNVNQPSATLTFLPGTGNNAKELLGKVTIDATALETITLKGSLGTATLKTLTVEGVTSDATALTIENLPSSVNDVIGIASDDQIKSYAPTYAVGGASIVLDGELTADTTYFYEITPETKKAEDEKHSTVTYTLGARKTVDNTAQPPVALPTSGSKSYYKVVYTASTNTYAVSYEANNVTSGDNVVDMTKSCWAGVAIDGTGLARNEKVTVTGAGENKADTYAVSALYGVDVQAVENSHTTLAGVTRSGNVAAALQSDTGLVTSIALKVVDSKNYYAVTIADDANTGAKKISIAKAAETPQSPAEQYFKITESDDTITLTYVNADSTKRLADLIDSAGEAFRIAVDATGIGTGKTVVITDGATGASTNVDYAVTHLPAGTEVTNNTTNNDTLAYDTGYVANNISLVLNDTKMPDAAGAASTWYLVNATTPGDDDKGVSTVTVTKVTGDAPTEDDKKTKNYFEVKATKGVSEDSYTVTYYMATESNKVDLASAGGKITVDATGLAKDSAAGGITIKLDGNTNDTANLNKNICYVTGLDEKNMPATETKIQTSKGSNQEAVTNLSYKDYYALTPATTIALDGTQANTYYVVTTETTKGTHTVKITDGAGTTTKPDDTKSYFLATVADGKLTLTFHEGTDAGATKKAEINGLAAADKFIVDAEKVGSEVTDIVLTTDSSDLTANYSVTNIPSTVTKIDGKGTNDEIAYTKSYVLGEANKISLTATEGTVYYAVTATGGKDDTTDRGIYTCAIGTTALKEAPGSGNYFTVKTNGIGASVTYTSGGDVPLPFTSVQNVIIDATNAESGTYASPKIITLADSGVGKWNVIGLDAGQTVSTSGTYAVTYEPSYSIKYNSGDEIALDNSQMASNPAEYYAVTVSASKTGATDSITARGVLEYEIGAKVQLGVGAEVPSNVKHYIKVTYDSAWNVSVVYVNADSDPDFDLSDTEIGRIKVNAQALQNTNVDTITFTGADQANYEITHAKKGTIYGTGADDVINYDAEAKLAAGQSIDLATLAATEGAGVEYYLVAGKVSGKDTDIENCTVTKTTADKLTDASNYFTVTKDASGNYTVAYTTAKSGDALNLSPSTSTLTVANASKIDSRKGITVSGASVTANMEDLQAITVTGDATVTYKSTFAWAAGDYYLPVAGTDKGATIEVGTTTITPSDSAKYYLKVSVSETSDGYQLSANKVYKPDSATGIMGTETTYTGQTSCTVTLPSITGFKFDADQSTFGALKEINNVPTGAVLKNVGTATVVTTAALAKDAEFTIGSATYTSGAANNVISVTGAGTIAGGTLVLDEAMAAALSTTGTAAEGKWNSVQVKTVPQGSDGVIITVDAETHFITGITGLEQGEVVQVSDGTTADGTTTYQYAYSDDGRYIIKTVVKTGATTKTAATTGNFLESEYGTGAAIEVGKFVWSPGTYYVAAEDGTADLEAAASTGTAVKDTYYVKAEISNDNVLTLSTWVGAGEGLINKTTAFTGTVNIAAPEIAFTYDKASNKTFKLNVTDAMTGSTFANLVAGDSVTSAAGASITMDNVAYAATAGSTLTFVGAEDGARLQAGTLAVPASTTLKLSDGSTVATAANTSVEIVVTKDDALKSLKGMETDDETVTVTTDAYTEVYKASDSGATITCTKTITATGEVTTTTYKPATPGGEVLGLDPVTTEGSVTSDFDWSNSAKNVAYIKIEDANGTVTIDNSAKSTTQSFTKTDLGFIKLEKSFDSETGVNTVTVTPMAVGSDGVSLVEDTTGRFMGTVTIAASGTAAQAKLKYDGADKGDKYKIAFTGVASGSVFDNLAKGDTVTSAGFTSDAATVEANGVTFKSGISTSNTIELYSDGKTAHIVSGTIVATGTVTASNDGVGEETLVYDKGTSTGNEGVIVSYTTGASGAIKGLDAGETVTVTKADGSVKEYYAKTTEVFYKTETTAAGVTTIGAFSSGTSNLDITTQTYETVVDGTEAATLTFDWGKTTGKNVSYSLIGDTARDASVAAGTTTLTYENFGKTYLVGTYDTGTNEITFKKAAVLATGKLDTAQNLGASDVNSLTIDAAKNTIKYTKANIDDVTVTNAGAGSTFTSFTAAEVAVTSTALTAGDTITIGSAVYTAGADNAVLVIEKGDTTNGNKVVSGTYKLVETANQNKIYTYVQDSTTKTTTTSTVICNTGTSGAVVEVSEGIVGAVKGLDTASEKVTVETVVAEKDGTTTTTETIYTVTAAADRAYTVEKQETVNGVKTVYTQTFTSATQDVTTTTGWKTTGVTTASTFDWTNTGYFLADGTGGAYVVDSSGKIKTQTGEVKITKNEKNNVYIVVDSEKQLDGSFVVNNIKLMQVQTNGSLKEITGTLGEITITAPSGNLTLPIGHTGTFTIEATESMSYVVGANDIVSVTFNAETDKIIVNEKTYNSGITSGSDTTLINGDGSVKHATLTVGSTEMTDVKGNKIEATVGNAVVVFHDTAGINSIKLGAVKDSVTYTDTDGVLTVYTADASDAKKITKTITAADGVIEAWKKTLSSEGDEVMTGGYGIDSRFDWGEETGKSFGYFAIGDQVTTQTSGTVTPSGANWFVRVVATKDSKGVYNITSLKRFANASRGLVEKAANDGITAVKITAPGSLTLDSGAITLVDGDGNAITRTYPINVTGATAGGVYTGFAVSDTITANLAASDTITVNSKKYQVWNPGSAQFYGTGEAIKGAFDISSTYKSVSMMTAATGGASTVVEFSKGDGARLLVSSGQLSKITNFNTNGESIKVTETTAKGVVTVTTYTAATKDGITTVTKEVVADGSTKKYTGTLDNDVLAIDDWTDTGDVTTTSQFDWTAAGGPGFFAVTPTVDSEGKITALGKADVAEQTTKLSITKANKGKYYLKVSLSADNEVDSVALYTVESNGALTLVDVAKLTGTINITAPSEKLTYANKVTEAGIAVNITGAADGSTITLKKGDTLTTATLAAPVTTGTPPSTTYEAITIFDGTNSNTYKAGAKGVLTFSMDDTTVAQGTTAIVVTSGTLALEAGGSFKAAGAASTSATDNVNVAATGGAATVTVAGGLVTGVAVANSATLTTTSDAATVAYSLSGTALEANITAHTSGKTFTLATLGNDEVVKVSGTATYTSGAAANTITLSDEGNTLTVLDGVLKMTSGTTINLTGTSAATDKITATFTAATGSNSTPILTVENGVIKSVTGLGKGTSAGDKLEVVDNTQTNKTITTTYQLSATGTAVTKTEKVTDSSGATPVVTTKTYTAYIAAGSDLMKASYISGDGSGDTLTEKPVVGQFSWNAISGRATGYFKIGSGTKNSVNVVEQASEVALAKSASATVPQRYVVGTVSDAAGDNLAETGQITRRQLALGVLQVDDNGALMTEDVYLTAADTINIAAPTTPIAYTKDGAFHAVFTKVAAESTFTNLAAGDKVTTASLTAGDIVAFDGNNYVAGANGTLAFIGQTTGDPAVYNTALLTGTIKLTGQENAVLAGANASESASSADDVIVTVKKTVNNAADTDTEDEVIVKVANGKVSSITGVKTAGTTVTVAVDGTTYVYTALDSNEKGSTMFSLTTDGENYSYKNFAAGANFYSEGGTAYKELAKTKVTKLDWENAAAFNTYVTLPDNLPTDTSGVSISKSSAAGVVKQADFQSLPTKYYLNLKGSTAVSKGLNVVKVTGLSLMQADGSGTLKAVNAKAKTQYYGTVTVNTSDEATPTATYAGLEYTLPTANRTWKLAGTVGMNSTIKNLADGDKINTGNGTFAFGTNGTAFNIYKADNSTSGTEVTTITSSGINTGAVATVSDQALTSVTNMTKGKITIVENTETNGLVTKVYEWKKVSGVDTLYQTVTAADGKVTVKTGALGTSGDILGNDVVWETENNTSINSVFDWTLDKAATGYFKVTGTTAAAKGITTKIADTKKDANTYIKLTLDTTNKTDAVVSGTNMVKAVKFNASTGAEEASTFSGKLTVTGPKTALTFDRGVFDTSMDGTTLAFTNIVSGSDITNLVAGDKVTTASFAKPTTLEGVMTAASTITLGGLTFSAGAAGTMEFTVQDINTDDPHYTLTKGSALLDSTIVNTEEGGRYLYAGTTKVEAKANAGGRSQITVTASANGANFTVGGISENEQFVVTNKDWAISGNEVTFTRSGSTLFCTYETEAGETITKAYAKLGTAADASITSANLDKAVNAAATDKTWVTLAKTFYTADDGSEKSKYYGSVTVDLAKAATRITADTKAGTLTTTGDVNADYAYVVDTYLSDKTAESATKALAAAVVKTQDTNWQTLVGEVDVDSYTYSAAGRNIGQTIKAAKDWNVIGSEQADIITGASANSVVNKVQNVTKIDGGAGNDTITGGGATENFVVSSGKDVLKSYTSGKDKVTMANFDLANVYLAGEGLDTNQKTTLKGVLLHDGIGTEAKGYSDATDSVLLVGVAGKAVKINDTTYYFGDGTKKSGNATFTYEEGARYYANDALTNTLKVATDKTKATKTTLGDTVSVDLLNNASDYINIDAIDASASGNSLILTASEKGSTLKGGTYQTTLRGGAGNDVLQGGSGLDIFSFKDGFGGSDTVKSYTSGKDAIYAGLLGDGKALSDKGVDISASGNSVVLKQGTNGTVTIENAAGATKALNISKDGTSTNTLSYYVANSTAKTNTFTATVGTNATIDDDTNEIALTSYYVGGTNATDTLKIANKKKTAEASVSLAGLTNDGKLTSIETLDVSGLASENVTVQGAAGGTFTLVGSNSRNVKETFDLSNFTAGSATIKNLSVGDVIEIAEGATVSSVKNVATLTWSDGSTVTLTGIKDFATAFGKSDVSAGGKFTRTK